MNDPFYNILVLVNMFVLLNHSESCLIRTPLSLWKGIFVCNRQDVFSITAALWYHRKISQVDTKLACKQKTMCSNWWIYLWRSQCGFRSSPRLRPRSRALPLLHKRPPIKTNINSKTLHQTQSYPNSDHVRF